MSKIKQHNMAGRRPDNYAKTPGFSLGNKINSIIASERCFMVSLLLILCISLAIFYATCYPSHLLWQEQNQIFLNTHTWIATYFQHPAWLGCLVGDWLTQFFANVWIGAFILSVSIVLCVLGFGIVCLKLAPKWISWLLTALWTVLLVGCSMPASTSLSFFICIAGGIGLGFAEFQISFNKDRKLNLSPLLVALAYWAFGFGTLLTALIITLLSIKRGVSKKGDKFWRISAICALMIAMGFPALLCKSYALPYSKALLYPGLASPTMPQMKYERRLAISDAFYKRDYDRVRQLTTQDDSPDDVTAFYYYLSSAVKDSLPDNLMKYPVKSLGTLTTIGEKSPIMIINMMNDLYYELGDMTYAERAAMMRNVFSPRNRNVRMMQRLAEVNLVSGDTAAALKYLRILDRTHSYSEWSKSHTPEKMKKEVETEVLNRRIKSNDKDNIRLGDNCRNIILELLESNPHNTVALDYLLCTDLLLKDMDTFKMDYDTYCIEKGSPRYKDLYQQALMIYLAGTGAPQKEWERYIVSQPQLQLFNQYSNRRGDAAFKGTYLYYFDKE